MKKHILYAAISLVLIGCILFFFWQAIPSGGDKKEPEATVTTEPIHDKITDSSEEEMTEEEKNERMKIVRAVANDALNHNNIASGKNKINMSGIEYDFLYDTIKEYMRLGRWDDVFNLKLWVEKKYTIPAGEYSDFFFILSNITVMDGTIGDFEQAVLIEQFEGHTEMQIYLLSSASMIVQANLINVASNIIPNSTVTTVEKEEVKDTLREGIDDFVTVTGSKTYHKYTVHYENGKISKFYAESDKGKEKILYVKSMDKKDTLTYKKYFDDEGIYYYLSN